MDATYRATLQPVRDSDHDSAREVALACGFRGVNASLRRHALAVES